MTCWLSNKIEIAVEKCSKRSLTVNQKFLKTHVLSLLLSDLKPVERPVCTVNTFATKVTHMYQPQLCILHGENQMNITTHFLINHSNAEHNIRRIYNSFSHFTRVSIHLVSTALRICSGPRTC